MDYEKEFGAATQKKWFYLPKIGGPAVTFTVKEIRKKEGGNPKYNFTRKTEVTLLDGSKAEKTENLGYQMECECTDGKILSVSSLGAFLQVFVKNDIQEGDTVTVEHKEKGVWVVTKNGEKTIDLDEPPVEEPF